MVSVELIPDTDHCIKTVAKRKHAELSRKLLSGEAGNSEMEVQLEILRRFLETADFGTLRTESEAELIKGESVRFTVYMEDDVPTYKMYVTQNVKKWTDKKTVIWHIALGILGIACFPLNPLVLAGIIKTDFNLVLFILGWFFWAAGMILVMAPFIMFPKKGGVPKGKSFVHTTNIVNTGIYAVVRHPQYLGGIISIFITTFLWYPHWLFAVLGITGIGVLYWSTVVEDRFLVEQFGTAYRSYMKEVPRMNIIAGFINLLKRKKHKFTNKSAEVIEEELQTAKDHLREGPLKYTRKAFQMLPYLERPSVLDIGCGSGVPTIELAKLTGGKITAIDINDYQLNRLKKKVDELGLSDRITVTNRSMTDLDFPAESFDLIWAEGSIAAVGFESGIQKWRGFIKPGGFLVVHDDLGNLEQKTGLISRCGYILIDHFVINQDAWWTEYYDLLDKKIKEIRQKHPDGDSVDRILEGDQKEVDGYGSLYQSVFFIMKKDETIHS